MSELTIADSACWHSDQQMGIKINTEAFQQLSSPLLITDDTYHLLMQHMHKRNNIIAG